ncbi:unnamed protein product [Schistocephalus solidus]|uniref:Glycosyltransferase n=1 Tax=Schistocephalus solidus TaxID=70667 RepID=A0A183TMB0_SCHSO|nr:unnamed protein product [Schistocephalus solidus]
MFYSAVNAPGRVLRHNQAMKLLASKLVKRGHKVLLLPHIPEGRTFQKPDLVLCAEDCLTVADIAVGGEDLMETVYAGKIRYYRQQKSRRIYGGFLATQLISPSPMNPLFSRHAALCADAVKPDNAFWIFRSLTSR